MSQVPAKSFLSRGVRQSEVFAYDYFLLLVLAAMWGGSFILQKVAVEEVTPVTMTAMRQVLATVFMAVILIFAGLKLSVTRKDQVLLMVSALIGTALPFSLISWGVQTLDSGIAAVLMGGMPILTIIIAHFATEDEKLNWSKVVAVLLGFIGLIVLFWPAISNGVTNDLIAQLVVLLAAFCYSVNTLITKKLLHLEAPVMLGYLSLWSALMLIVAAYMFEIPNWSMPSNGVSLAIFILAIFPSAIAAFIMYELIARQGAGFFGQINLLVPLSGVVWGFLFLGERLSLNALIAMLIILCGVGVSRNWNANKIGDVPKQVRTKS